MISIPKGSMKNGTLVLQAIHVDVFMCKKMHLMSMERVLNIANAVLVPKSIQQVLRWICLVHEAGSL